MGKRGSGRSSGRGSPGLFSRKGTSSTSHTSPNKTTTEQSRKSSTLAAPTTARQPAHSQAPSQSRSQANTQTPNKSTSQSTPHSGPQAVSQGPGLLTQIAANAASTAIGVAAAHGIMNLFGGREVSQQEVQQLKEGPCGVQYEGFMSKFCS